MLNKYLIIAISLVLFLFGCTNTEKPLILSSHVQIGKLSIVNYTYDEVHDFKLIAPKTNTYLSADYITGGRKFVMLVFKKFERKETGLLKVSYTVNNEKLEMPLTLVTPLTNKDKYDVVVELDKHEARASFQ